MGFVECHRGCAAVREEGRWGFGDWRSALAQCRESERERARERERERERERACHTPHKT